MHGKGAIRVGGAGRVVVVPAYRQRQVDSAPTAQAKP